MTHAMLAVLTKSDRWAIAESESEQLAEGVKNVARHYGDIPGLNEKTTDWIALIYALGMVYGTRIADAMAEEKKPAPQPVKTPEAKAMTLKTPPETQTINVPGVGQVEAPFQ